jgi:hypothetical protein
MGATVRESGLYEFNVNFGSTLGRIIYDYLNDRFFVVPTHYAPFLKEEPASGRPAYTTMGDKEDSLTQLRQLKEQKPAAELRNPCYLVRLPSTGALALPELDPEAARAHYAQVRNPLTGETLSAQRVHELVNNPWEIVMLMLRSQLMGAARQLDRRLDPTTAHEVLLHLIREHRDAIQQLAKLVASLVNDPARTAAGAINAALESEHKLVKEIRRALEAQLRRGLPPRPA